MGTPVLPKEIELFLLKISRKKLFNVRNSAIFMADIYLLRLDVRVVERRDLFREFLWLVYVLLRPTIAVG